MRQALRILLWLVFAASCGIAGYWQGIEKGGANMANISTGLDASRSINGLESAMAMAAEQDPETLRKRHEMYFRQSLMALGTAGKYTAYHRCAPRQQKIVADAAVFVSANPDVVAKSDPLVVAALNYCEPK